MDETNRGGQFLTGVNYWASHAGIFMWRDWDEQSVRDDFRALTKYGVKVLRVFPLWSDFQPVTAVMTSGPALKEYRLENDALPRNPFYLDETMMERFCAFCACAEEYGLKLIVGLITGWMSGRLFVPPAIVGKKVFSDPEALYFQQLFIRGFLRATKQQKSIMAWDLGNECNCMQHTNSRAESACWTAAIVNAIRSEDESRPVISGMHSLEPEGAWTPADQGFWTDMLTTHPYPYWVPPCSQTPIDSFRTLLSATAQTEYYAGLGEKKCLVEELGTMGPMVCDDEIAAGFLRVNLWSNWAHGASGLLWWCGFDQNLLTRPPYDWNMCERELGFLRFDRTPKPVAEEMCRFADELEKLNFRLPEKQTDAVCILSAGQQQWPIAYMSELLAKQAGLTLRFVWQDQELPSAPVYLLPSVKGPVMSKLRWDALKQKVREGAALYLSMDDAILTEFEDVTGFRLIRRWESPEQGMVKQDGQLLSYHKDHSYEFMSVSAQVLLSDGNGKPLLGRHAYGRGQVYFSALPIERMLLDDPQKTDEPWYRIYEKFCPQKLITKTNPRVGLTVHSDGDGMYAVLINYSNAPVNANVEICEGMSVHPILGNPEEMEPFGAAVLRCEPF